MRALIVLGLSAMAVTQPLLDLFGNNAEFFVAGNYSTGQIVAFVLLVAVVPPFVGISLIAACTVVDRRAGTVAFVVVATVFASAFGLALLRALGVDALWLVVAIAVGIGVATAFGVARFRAAQLLATYLAAANLLFVGIFVFVSPASSLLVGDGVGSDVGEVTVPDLQAPVVVIILDELPAPTIMRGDGTINDERYPGFARLAEVSTWFRNASSRHVWTPTALPAILTGNAVGRASDLPTAALHPRNLFTLLGGDLPVHRYEPITDLCPDAICTSPDGGSLRQALSDASVVYGHRVLPSSLRDGLPAIDNSWGDYGAADGDAAPDADGSDPAPDLFARWNAHTEQERSPRGQAFVLADRLRAVTAEPALHVVHVALPHFPWTLSSTGFITTYAENRRPEDLDPAAGGFEFRARVEYQLHSMQVGATDVAIGDALDHLMSLPNWDDLTLVVTSDHGIGLTAPDLGRKRVTDRNRAEVYRVPLFIKAPGQTRGEVRDDSAQMIDVLPSIVDLLEIDVDRSWDFDGHSLYDGSAPDLEPLVSADVDEVLDIAERRAEQFPNGDDWLGLAAAGEHGDLVGSDAADLEVGDASAYAATLRDEDLLADLPTDDGAMPFILVGTVTGPPGDDSPPELVAAVNGTIAGVVGGYRPAGDGWEFVGYVADLYQEGANTVDLYEVERAGSTVTLHPLGTSR